MFKIFTFKFWIIPVIFILSFGYLYITKSYHSYCKYAQKTNDYLVKDTSKELYKELCHGVFKDFNNHSIMKYSLNSVYTIMGANSFDDYQIMKMRKKLNTTNYSSLKAEFRTLQIVHLVFYFFILYLVVLWIPGIIINLLSFFMNKFMFLVFILLLVEGFANLYMDLNVDIFRIMRSGFNYLPTGFIFGSLKSIIKMVL